MPVTMTVPRTAPPDVTDASDALLVGRAADGDQRAFATLVRRYSPTLRSYARRVLGSSSDVDDVVQDSLVTAWQQLPSLTDAAAVRGWLIRITTRKALDRVRARKPTTDIDDHDIEADDGLTPERQATASARRSALDQALSALPEQQRRTWVMHEAGGLSYSEIAEQLEVPPSTVRGLLARARKQLIQQMEAWR